MKPPIPRKVAIHEAGHAIAHCRYRQGFRMLWASGEGVCFTDTKGRKIGIMGECEGRTFEGGALLRDKVPYELERAQYRHDAFRSMVVLFAGGYAEARHLGCLPIPAELGGGYSDFEKVELAAAFVADDEKDKHALFTAAVAEAKRLVSDPDMWGRICALADLLQERGRIEADEPDVAAVIAGVERIPLGEIPFIASEEGLLRSSRDLCGAR
jgi:hypothetical protein